MIKAPEYVIYSNKLSLTCFHLNVSRNSYTLWFEVGALVVRIAFLCGDFEENIWLRQLDLGKENCACRLKVFIWIEAPLSNGTKGYIYITTSS